MKGQKGRVLISSIFAVLLCPGVPGGWEWGGGVLPVHGLYGKALSKRGTFPRFQVYIGVEAY